MKKKQAMVGLRWHGDEGAVGLAPQRENWFGRWGGV